MGTTTICRISSELKIEDADVKDDVKMASKWRGISIHGHITPFSCRL